MLAEVRKYENKMIQSLGNRAIDFEIGDTITVGVRIIDGSSERIQDFQGICIAIRNKGLMTNFIVRKISDDIIVQRNFILHSPLISYINITRKGKVRRAKLYYINKLRGKSARIAERKSNKKDI